MRSTSPPPQSQPSKPFSAYTNSSSRRSGVRVGTKVGVPRTQEVTDFNDETSSPRKSPCSIPQLEPGRYLSSGNLLYSGMCLEEQVKDHTLVKSTCKSKSCQSYEGQHHRVREHTVQNGHPWHVIIATLCVRPTTTACTAQIGRVGLDK